MLNWINKKRNRKGFTLVELVVVIAILGILAGIAVPKLGKSRENAAIAAHNANVRTLESAATMAIADGLTNGTWTGTTSAEGTNDYEKWENYVQSWPSVPTLIQGKKAIADDGIDSEIASVESSYSVTITNGVIEIKPTKIKKITN